MGVLGIDVGGTNIRVGLVEYGGLVRTESLKIKNDSSETEIIDDLNSLIGKFGNEKIDGIGIGVPSLVDAEKGIIYDGRNCGAGEFGMMPFRDHNYEYYCSGQFFKNEYGMSGEEVVKKAELGDTTALKIFSQFGSNLGEAIKVIMLAVDPEIIILGGSVSKSYQFFKDNMWKSIRQFIYSKLSDNIKIEF